MTNPDIVIRNLTSSDRDAWEPLWQGYLTFYKSTLPPETTDATFARLTDDTTDVVGLAACNVKGALVGFTHYVIHPSTWSRTGYCYLEDLFVDPAARGGGHARALIAEVDRRGKAAGCDRVYWHTQESNARARALYDKVANVTEFVKYQT